MASLYPHRNGPLYGNEPGEGRHGFALQTLIMYCLGWRSYKHKSEMSPFVSTGYDLCHDLPRVTWLGHAGLLIEASRFSVIIDPVFFNLTPFFRRIVSIEHLLLKLPTIDAVLISHNHWDHADHKSLKFIASRNPHATLYVPQGDLWWGHRLGFKRAIEATWWDRFSLGGESENGEITFLPAHHWSQSTPFDRNRSLWGSWMVNIGGRAIYHGGDTAFWHHFEIIAKEFPTIDLACLPIGPCEPREWLSHSHMGPEDALRAAKILNAGRLLPIHWGTYWFGIDRPLQPLERLQSLVDSTSMSSILHVPIMGKAIKASLR